MINSYRREVIETLFNVISIILCVLYSVGIIVAFTEGRDRAYEELYPRTAVVSELDTESDTVTVIDGSGVSWQFFGCEDLEVCDFVSLLMSDNGTPDSIYDDEIREVRYAGFQMGGLNGSY